ncbi:MAG: VCBS repeat-containing protein [Cyclobacteriaceae bacterium]
MNEWLSHILFTNGYAGLNVHSGSLVFVFSAFFLGSEVQSQHFQDISTQMNLDNLSHHNGNAVADYDRDGDLDIFIVALKSYSSSDLSSKSILLRNDEGRYTDVTSGAGFGTHYANSGEDGIMGQKMGVAWGDFDNDGFPDLILTHYRKIQLFHNEGDGTFKEVTSTAGIEDCFDCYNSSALWWDYDRDGNLDLYISDWKKNNRLFRNNGDGSFSNKSKITNLDDAGNTWTSIPLDVNNDGWQDLYVVNDFYRNRFYLNMEGVYFRELTERFGLEDYGNGMGVTTGDYNNDGLFDIYLTNIFEDFPNPLFTCNAEGYFTEDANPMGVDDAGWAWGTSFFDADLDGDEDLYVVNGHESSHHQNKFFKNMRFEGQDNFRDWSANSQANGELDAMSLSTFDYDNDGDLDMFVSNTNGSPYFYQNQEISETFSGSYAWFKVELEGSVSNRDALGTLVELYSGENTLYRFYHGAGLLSQNLQAIHFGLGKAKKIDSLIVKWPLSEPETLYDLSVNQTAYIKEHQEVRAQKALVVTSLEEDLEVEVNIYPNPFTEQVIIEFENSKSGKRGSYLQIFNLNGVEVHRSAPQNIQTDIVRYHWDGKNSSGADLKSGIYFFQLHLGDEIVTRKLLKTY